MTDKDHGPRPPTVTGNSLKFSSPSLLPRFFPSWTAQRMSCSCVSGPPRMESPFFVIEVGAHHIYDDTGFCHNYRHRSVIRMTEKNFVRPKMSRMCLFLQWRVWARPGGRRASLPHGLLVDFLTSTPTPLDHVCSKNNSPEGFIPFGFRLIFLFCGTLKQAKNNNLHWALGQ